MSQLRNCSLTLPQELTSLTQRTAKLVQLMVDNACPTAAGTTGTGMTLQVTVASGVLQLQRSNFKSGSDYQFHNVVEDSGRSFRDCGLDQLQLGLNPPATSGLSNDTLLLIRVVCSHQILQERPYLQYRSLMC